MDIKLENFVIPHGHELKDPLKSCKLIDFNSSIITKEQVVEKDNHVGTLSYLPPEIKKQKPPFMVNFVFSFLHKIFTNLNSSKIV